jgi:tetratricopeptide (TPR) repeat protein
MSSSAYQAYLKGRYHINKVTEDGVKRSMGYFQQAIDLDPHFALAYAGLAQAYHQSYFTPPRERMPKARAAAERALQLDDTLAEARAALGWVSWRYDWDWQKAEREVRRAIDLNPNSASVHATFCYFLSSMGRHREALREQLTAEELDPLSPIIDVGHGRLLYFWRRYDEAIARYQKTLELDPHFAMAHAHLGQAYLRRARLDEALASCRKAGELDSTWDPIGLAAVYASLGSSVEAWRILEKLKQEAERGYQSAVDFAIAYAALGETDLAFESLDKAYTERDGLLVFLKVAPEFDPLRTDPRFTEILRKVGLVP